MAHPLAILSFGAAKDPWIERYLDEHAGCEWRDHSYDLRVLLKDPLSDDRVSHHENGTHAKTMVAVMGQSSWQDVVSAMIDYVIDYTHSHPNDKGMLLPIYCSKGQHRSDVSARFVAEACQSLRHQGLPIFDVQLFAMSECQSKHDKVNSIQKALLWSHEPWACPAPASVPAERRYGMQESRARPQSSEGILGAWAHVDWLQSEMQRPLETADTDAAIDDDASEPAATIDDDVPESTVTAYAAPQPKSASTPSTSCGRKPVPTKNPNKIAQA